MVAQWEAAPTTGQLHMQGYVELGTKRTKKALIKILAEWMPPDTCHTPSIARAGQPENRRYCFEDASDRVPGTEPYEWGTPMKQGERNDIAECVETLRGGGTLMDLLNKDPSSTVKYLRAFKEIQQMMIKPRSWPMQLYFLWGAAGTGKSYRVNQVPDVQQCIWEQGKFLSGYKGGERIGLEEFKYETMAPTYFNMLVDRNRMEISVKGSTLEMAAKEIYFTSQTNPFTWWPDEEEETRRAIHRRIYEFTDNGKQIYTFYFEGSGATRRRCHRTGVEGLGCLWDPVGTVEVVEDIRDFFGARRTTAGAGTAGSRTQTTTEPDPKRARSDATQNTQPVVIQLDSESERDDPATPTDSQWAAMSPRERLVHMRRDMGPAFVDLEAEGGESLAALAYRQREAQHTADALQRRRDAEADRCRLAAIQARYAGWAAEQVRREGGE